MKCGWGDPLRPGRRGGLRQIGAEALRGLLRRASVSAALTCEQSGAQSPDTSTLDAAMAAGPRLMLPGEPREAGLEPA
jgi:hypothetical protein